MRLLAACAIILLASPASAILNPHYDANSCGSCHLKEPTAGQGGAMDFHFLGEEIDRTCMICHTQDCCSIAKPHEATHASGIDKWDKRKYGQPEKLPLTDGYITCVTCHFWRRANNPASEDYKLVRIVAIKPTGVDWAGLCVDCHKEQ